ncbi:MAG: valine--tRNA ligase [Chitinophagaceae bacterium]|nr:valine--tRNA ligase [Chitinophagaceae bacterium]
MELSKNFEPARAEEKWTEIWKQKGYFSSVPDERTPYTLVIPPPNVTGVLHMGHTLNETVQDILARHARMNGYNVCWVPGSDHASIATEARVVDMLKREKGIQKKDLSREEFLKYAFEWKEKYGGIIYKQIERLGCSVDWNRVSFTMDKEYYAAVIKVFVELYRQGLIYRGARMINWDTVAKTALSDEEVEYKDVQGTLYYIKYRIAGEKDKFITIATQRPETIMGDVAVCANPSDERFGFLKNKSVLIPMVNREVPVIFDDYVDKSFGTGILKITPAHDINDFNLGLKYNLPVIDTLNDDGTLSEKAKVFVGMDRFEAREKVIEKLKSEGLLVKEESYETRIGYSQRTHSVVEPRISTQWFVKMKELADPALKEVMDGNIKIHPHEKFIATYQYWLENVKDWCISRQLWWGQQIPAWYDKDGNIYVGENIEDVRNHYRLEKTFSLRQDEDVLDTWFSSWLWPIEVFKGITDPENNDFKYYYPTTTLVTGQDIIFFWVARMIMAGLRFTGKKPFSDVYFTGMVRDNLGRKMSKSLGNSPDLLKLIDEYGADAVRFGIMISSPAGNDLLFDEASLEQGIHFNNKIWNALRLIKMWSSHEDFNKKKDAEKGDPFAIEWFGNRLNEAQNEVEKLIENFKLSEALKVIYSLIWDDFCSWYLEWIKPSFGSAISKDVYDETVVFFDRLLQILHPYMPFITEEIYSELKKRDSALSVAQTIPPSGFEKDILKRGNHLKDLISSIRDARNKFNLPQKESVQLYVHTDNEKAFASIGQLLKKQVHADDLFFNHEPEENSIQVVCGTEKILMVTGVEVDTGKQREQLEKDLSYLRGFLKSVEKKLSNERFVQNAKPEIVELEKKKQSDAMDKIKVLEQSLESLKN